MSTIAIRAFEECDVAAVLALWSASDGLGHGPGDTPDELRRYLARNAGISSVAVDGEAVVGAVLCGHDGRRGVLYRLAVAKSHRRRGVGRALVERALAALRAARISRCMLYVLGANAGGLAFWTSLGATHRPELHLLSIDLEA